MKIIKTIDAFNSANANFQAVRHNNTLYISGQVPKDATTGDIVGDNVAKQTDQVFRNIKAILAAAGTSLDNIIMTTVYLQNRADYDSFNDAYRRNIKKPYPARTTVEVGNLAVPVLIEISAVAAI